MFAALHVEEVDEVEVEVALEEEPEDTNDGEVVTQEAEWDEVRSAEDAATTDSPIASTEESEIVTAPRAVGAQADNDRAAGIMRAGHFRQACGVDSNYVAREPHESDCLPEDLRARTCPLRLQGPYSRAIATGEIIQWGGDNVQWYYRRIVPRGTPIEEGGMRSWLICPAIAEVLCSFNG